MKNSSLHCAGLIVCIVDGGVQTAILSLHAQRITPRTPHISYVYMVYIGSFDVDTVASVKQAIPKVHGWLLM